MNHCLDIYDICYTTHIIYISSKSFFKLSHLSTQMARRAVNYRTIDLALKPLPQTEITVATMVIFIVTELHLFAITDAISAFLADHPYIVLIPTTVATNYQQCCHFLLNLRTRFLGMEKRSYTKIERKIWGAFHRLFDNTNKPRLGLSRKDYDNILGNLNTLHRDFPESDMCSFISLFVQEDTDLLHLIEQTLAPRQPRVSARMVAANLPLSVAMCTSTPTVFTAIDKMPREMRSAIISGETSLHELLGLDSSDTEHSVAMCTNSHCPNRWTHDEFIHHLPEEGWIFGKYNSKTHLTDNVPPEEIKTPRKGSFLPLLRFICRKCDTCERFVPYNFYLTQWQSAGGDVAVFQTKMTKILFDLLPSVGFSVKYCPDKKCSFSLAGLLCKDGTQHLTCNGCNAKFCTECDTIITEASHDCAVLTQRTRAHFELLIAQWELQQCPCGRYVNKSADCDHITCTCGTHFCYNCGKEYESRDGIYRHIYNCRTSRERFMRAQQLMIERNPDAESDPVNLYKVWKALREDVEDTSDYDDDA